MPVQIPVGLRHALADDQSGRAWLDTIPELAERAAERWDLELGTPFEGGMAAWTAPATAGPGTAGPGIDAVLKLSLPHPEARDEAAALQLWRDAGAVEVLGTHQAEWALLLRRARPGTSLRDEQLPPDQHLSVGAHLLRQLAAVSVPAGQPFRQLVDVAADLAAVASERIERLLPSAPITVDSGLVRHAVDLLTALPQGATRTGLTHGDLNPGNILRHDEAAAGGRTAATWQVIDPKPVWGDLAWDPWPLLTQVGDWTDTAAPARDLAERTRLVADATELDAARIASWCVARSVESALWAADRDWWTGDRGADGDLERAAAWAGATDLLGG